MIRLIMLHGFISFYGTTKCKTCKTSIAAIQIEGSKVGKTGSLKNEIAQFLLLSIFESAWMHRKRRAFMWPRHYARDIIYDCIATQQSPVNPSARHSNLRVRWAMAANDPGMQEGRAILNSNQIYRAVRTFILISDVAATNCSYVLRHLHRVLTLARC